jgi:hypothetical protein
MGWLGARLKQFVSTVGAPPVELTYISSVPSEPLFKPRFDQTVRRTLAPRTRRSALCVLHCRI